MNVIQAVVVLFLFVSFLAIFGGGGFLWFIYSKRRSERENRSLGSVLLKIKVPRTNEIKIDAMEQVISSLASLKKGGWKMRFSNQPVVSFEIVGVKGEINFYVWTSHSLRDLVEKQIHGGYPDADIEEVPEYNIFTEGGQVSYKSLVAKKDSFYPLQTFKELPTDPMAAITSALAKMGDGEAAAIQVLLSPADGGWTGAGKHFISSTKKAESDPEKASYSVPAKTLEGVENKISKPGFETTIRIVVVSANSESANHHMSNITTAFSQFAGEHNSFTSGKIRRKPAFVEEFIYRYQPLIHFFSGQTSILNAEEVATIFHFPNKQITTPYIQWLNAKSAPAPAQIPTEGLYLGTSKFRGVQKKIFIEEEDRLRHTYIIGKTGTGKSQFLMSMIRQDMIAGRGLCFMDPHGDAVEELLGHVPPERAKDVIYFRPSDFERPMGLNLMEASTEEQKHFVTASVINMMYKLFDPYKTGIVGPRFEHTVRNAMLTIMSESGTTFIELMRILTDPNYVKEILPKVQDPIIRRFWTDQMAQTSDFHKSEVLDYITSKFGRFVTNKMVRNIIGQSESSFNFRDVMDNGKILLINLSKGELGEENSSFFGLILVPRILMAAMSRSDIPEAQRRDFYLYVDEFQNFATPDFAQILSEARKYRLGLTVANQFIGQIDQEVKDAIMGNVGSIYSYRMGVDDANYMARLYSPFFGEEDLQHIDKYHVYAKTLVNNEPVNPFSMHITLEKPFDEIKKQENPKIREWIRENSRLRFGRDLRLVESEIATRAKL